MDLIPINGMMQAQFISQNAPDFVRESWLDFVDAVANWKEPKTEG